MTIVLPMIFLSLAAGGVALATFLWSVANGQYDDLEGAAERLLMDDDDAARPPDGPASQDCALKRSPIHLYQPHQVSAVVKVKPDAI